MGRVLAVPHAYVQMEVDSTSLVGFWEANQAAYRVREGIGLSFVPFVVKAATEALRRHPRMNAHWTDEGLLVKRRIDVGVTIAADDGQAVPVIRNVAGLSINGINRALADLSARAAENRPRANEVGDGTFTIHNTGWLGSDITLPTINVPEVTVLTMEAIRKRPVIVETRDGDVIAIRSMMNMVVAFDHRANDGAGAAAFLRDVKDWLEAVGPRTSIY